MDRPPRLCKKRKGFEHYDYDVLDELSEDNSGGPAVGLRKKVRCWEFWEAWTEQSLL